MLYGSIGLVLFCFWLVLSGIYTVITVPAGILSVIGVVALAHRMGIADDEGHPIHLSLGALTYWPWLALEIAKSAWDVTKIILHPKLPISPTLIRIRASQRSAVGLATYANSITLTPGTITARVSGDEFLVHAVVRGGAKDLAKGTMDQRVKKFEGSK
ncbi:MAG: Na+/H+ antiporter subunit E [Gammaproteobacteria bacterium]